MWVLAAHTRKTATGARAHGFEHRDRPPAGPPHARSGETEVAAAPVGPVTPPLELGRVSPHAPSDLWPIQSPCPHPLPPRPTCRADPFLSSSPSSPSRRSSSPASPRTWPPSSAAP